MYYGKTDMVNYEMIVDTLRDIRTELFELASEIEDIASQLEEME